MENNTNIEAQLAAINQKLDFLTDEMHQQRQLRLEVQSLKAEIGTISKDIIKTVVEELDDMAEHFNSDHVIYLMKKLARNTESIYKAVDQLQATNDFIQETTPVVKEVFADIVSQMEHYSQKGYFENAKAFFNLFESAMDQISQEDIVRLTNNSQALIKTLKTFSPEPATQISFISLLKIMGAPEIRKLIASSVAFTKQLVANQQQNTMLTKQ